MKNKITQIYKFLLEKKFILEILDKTGVFTDEPQFPYYITLIHPEINFYNRNGWEYSPTGNTWNNSELALLKCLMEMLERTSQFYFDFNLITFYKESDISDHHIDLATFFKHIPSKKETLTVLPSTKFGWVKGMNATKNMEGFIPAQLIYPNYSQYAYYKKNIAEPTLISPINTFQGSAGGFSHASTLLRAIYEVVEREARTLFIYLRHWAIPLHINQIKNADLTKLLQIVDAYGFEIYAFNIMNDLGIPVIMTMLIDKSGIGPILNTGFKAGLKLEEALIGSIEDAFYQRYFQRIDIVRNPALFNSLDNIRIFNKTYRGKIYIFKEILDLLNFQFNQSIDHTVTDIQKDFIKVTTGEKQELREVIKRIESAGLDIWYYSFETINNVFIHKAVIPGLQPSIRKHKQKDYYQNRIMSSKKYYQSSKYYV